MKKHKTKMIASFAILVVLIGAWFMGSSHFRGNEEAPGLAEDLSVLEEATLAADPVVNPELPLNFGNISEVTQNSETPEQETPETSGGNIAPENTNNDTAPLSVTETEPTNPEPTPAPSPTPTALPTPDPSPPSAQTPPPETSFYVTLSVRVDTILHNMDLLDREKHELIPTNGVIFPATRIRVEQGESVFDVLQREMRRAGIHMSSRFTPAFNSAYVEAIHNIFEFDVGPLSGWMYRVNGIFPNFGSSQYILRPDDVIEWVYTVDLGRDVGAGAAFG